MTNVATHVFAVFIRFAKLSFVALFLFPCVLSARTTINLVTEIYPPYQVIDPNTQRVEGMRTEIVRELMEIAGVDYTLKAMPWARSYKAALTEPNTCIYSMIRLPFREPAFEWVAKIGTTSSVVYVNKLKKDRIKLSKLGDLRQYLTVVHRQDIIEQLLKRLGFREGQELFIVSDWKQAIDLVVKNRADIIVGNSLILSYYLSKSGIETNTLAPVLNIPQLTNVPHYLACHKQTSPVVLAKLRMAIKKAEEEGVVEALNQRWNEALQVVIPPHLRSGN